MEIHLQNVFLANALVDKMKDGGHDVMVVTKGCLEVLTMLERVVLSDEMRATTAPTKQRGGVTTDSNDPGRSERISHKSGL